jgi:hypothetical protein
MDGLGKIRRKKKDCMHAWVLLSCMYTYECSTYRERESSLIVE